MANVLIVDDDKNFLLSLVDGLKAYDQKYEVLTAGNGKEAIKVLENNSVDLMITDLKMPEMDGFQLLAHMVPNYPHIPAIVITAFATKEMEETLMNMGTFTFLEKPLDFNVMVEKINEGLDVRSHYFTKVLSLCSFLRMIEMERKTCTVCIRSHGRMGYLYFLNGQLIDGETGGINGESAVKEIVKWEAAEVELDGFTREKESRQIDVPLNFIVNEEIARISQVTQYIEDKEDSGDDKSGQKETAMNIEKLNQAMESLKEDLGDGLLGSGIVTRKDRKTIVDFNSNPKAGALFTQITGYLIRVLKECNMPPLGKYYFIHLADDTGIIAIPLGDYEWRISINLKTVTLGLLLNVTLPKIFNAFQEAANR